jgi:hypothetical protein
MTQRSGAVGSQPLRISRQTKASKKKMSSKTSTRITSRLLQLTGALTPSLAQPPTTPAQLP